MKNELEILKVEEKILGDLLNEVRTSSFDLTSDKIEASLMLIRLIEEQIGVTRKKIEHLETKPCPEYVKITRNEYNRSRRRDYAVQQFVSDYNDMAL